MKITTIGLDLAKSAFQVHGVDATGQVVVRKCFDGRRCCHFSPSCLRAWSALKRTVLYGVGSDARSYLLNRSTGRLLGDNEL
jgi:hypothetical protein